MHGLWFIGDIKYIIVIFTDIAIMIILGNAICKKKIRTEEADQCFF